MDSTPTNTAVFLGAGASVPFGFPLTRDLLPEIWRRLQVGNLFHWLSPDTDESDNRAHLTRTLEYILPGLGHVDAADLPLITEILSLIDYSLAMQHALYPGQSEQDLRRARHLIERALLELLLPPERYHDDTRSQLDGFIDWITHPTRQSSIVSTNYDITVESELFRRADHRIDSDFDFGFAWQDPGARARVLNLRPADARIHILKLHGALNWLRCASCENIYINPYGKIAHHAFREEVDEHNTCHCGHGKLGMHIIAPSLFREVRDSNLLEIWRTALAQLQQAQEWVLIGYSFPTEDIAIRSLFTRAINGHVLRSRKDRSQSGPRITVVQLGRSAQARYRAFFPGCQYLDGGLAEFLEQAV